MDIKSKIIKEVEEEIGAYAVMTVQDAMEKSPTLKGVIAKSEMANGDLEGFIENIKKFESQVNINGEFGMLMMTYFARKVAEEFLDKRK